MGRAKFTVSLGCSLADYLYTDASFRSSEFQEYRLIVALAEQLSGKNTEQADMYKALSWAVASGGFACFYIGGTYFETSPGKKLSLIEEYRQEWLHQTIINTGGHA